MPLCCAGNVLQYTQLAAVLMQAKQYNEAEALLHELLLHVETVKVNLLHLTHRRVILPGRMLWYPPMS